MPVAAPPKPKSLQEQAKEKAALVSPFKATLTTAGMYTGGWLNAPLNVDFLVKKRIPQDASPENLAHIQEMFLLIVRIGVEELQGASEGDS